MNSNLFKVGKPTRWPPGKSGNPAGKPPGTRTAFSQGFIRDFALVLAEEGLEAVRKVAKKSPEAFVAISFQAPFVQPISGINTYEPQSR